MGFATPGWITTFLLFVGFCVASYFAYDHISTKQRRADYAACVERIAMSSRSASEYHLSVTACDYLRRAPAAVVGRYSSIAGQPQRLAMVTRPMF